jgi:hypothetical protein
MFGRSVLGWLAVIAADVVVIVAGLWLLRGWWRGRRCSRRCTSWASSSPR